MKQIFLFFMLFFLFSCCKENTIKTAQYESEKKQQIELKYKNYKNGDIIYMKPDSIKCVIVRVSQNNTYCVEYTNVKRGERIRDCYVYPYEIY